MRTHPTHIRFAKAELDELRVRADAAGKHMSTFIRDATLAHCKVGLPDDGLALQIKREITDLFELLKCLDCEMREVLLLVKEILSKTDPQAVARIAASCRTIQPLPEYRK